MIGKIKENTKYVSLFLLVLMLVSTALSTTAWAANPWEDGFWWNQTPDENSIPGVVLYAHKTLKNPIKLGVFYLTYSSRCGLDLITVTAEPFFESPAWNVSTMFGGMYKALSKIGCLMCFLYFLLELMEHVTRDSFNIETFVKSFAKLIIMFIVFDQENMEAIMSFGSSLNNGLIHNINDEITTNAVVNLRSYVDTLNDTSWLKCIGYVFQSLFSSLVMFLVLIVVMFVVASRWVEVGVYSLFMPVGIAPIYSGGLNSSGFRYIKKLIALHLQGVVMAATLWAINQDQIKNSAVLTGVPLIGELIIGIVAVGVIAKSKSIASDIVGV